MLIYSSNVSYLADGSSIAIRGKNGFTSTLGSIFLTCNAVSFPSGSTMSLRLANLSSAFDSNYNKHVLNSKSDLGIANYIAFEILQKTPTANVGDREGIPGYIYPYLYFTANVVSFNVVANTVTINNPTVQGTQLSALLKASPFRAEILQSVSQSSFNGNNWVFVKGYKKQRQIATHSLTGQSGSITLPLGVTPIDKGYVNIYIDESSTPLASGDFVLNSNNSVTLSVSTATVKAETIVDYYTTPALEVNDNVTVGSNTFVVTDTSYIPSSPGYNSKMTTEQLYKVKLSSNITGDLTGATIVNVTPDYIGTVAAVNNSANTFNVSITSNAYPYTYNLANNRLYTIQEFSRGQFKKPDTTIGRLKQVELGMYTFRARNLTEYGKISNDVLRSVQIIPPALGKPTNASVEETTYIDTNRGAVTRLVISWDHILNRNVNWYDVYYKFDTVSSLDTDIHPSGIVDYIGTTISAESVDTDGRLKFVLNNIERGEFSEKFKVQVRIVPISGVFHGIPVEVEKNIVGKITPPAGLSSFTVVQQNEDLVFSWEFATKSDGFIQEQDSTEIEVRYKQGVEDLSSADLINGIYNSSTSLFRVSFPVNRYMIKIREFGSFAFTAATIDSSDNVTDSIVAQNFDILRSGGLEAYSTYNERDPTANVIAGVLNANYTDNAWTSFYRSDNGGFVYMSEPGSGLKSNLTENANGTSSSWTYDAATGALQMSTSQSVYISEVRDIGASVLGTIRVSANVEKTLSTAWNTTKDIFFTGVSDATDSNANLVDKDSRIGHLLGNANANITVAYNANLRTLFSNTDMVYAIWNPGKFAGDTTNANSFALIAGVKNANCIVMGQAYYSNGYAHLSVNTGAALQIIANMTVAGNNFQLVNLNQWNDLSSTTFAGEGRSFTTNVFVRTSNSNVFFSPTTIGDPEYNASFLGAHGNVNTNAFIASSASNTLATQGYELLSPGERTFRYFQVKVVVDAENVNTNTYKLRDLTYEVDLRRKTVSKKIRIDNTGNYRYDYSMVGFNQIPSVVVTPSDTANVLLSSVSAISTTGANIALRFTDGTYATNTNAEIIVQGI